MKAKARATHAAFLIFSLLGRNGTDFGNNPDSNYTGVQFAKLAFSDWANTVNWYAANGLANFNAYVAPPCAFGQTQTFNVGRYGQDVVFVLGNSCAPPAETIVFSVWGGGTFEINKSCANVKGPLTPLTGDFDATPSAQTPILTPDDSPTTAVFQASVNVNRAMGPVTITRQYFLRRGGADQAAFASFSANAMMAAGANSFPYTQNGIPGLALGDEVCQRVTVNPSAGKIDPNGVVVSPTVGARESVACSRFLHKPYSKVYGGDVAVGGGFGTGCAVDGEASLIGFNRGSNPFTGSGTQLAAFALGQILTYSDAQVSSPDNPRTLSFANTGSGYASSAYGGDLGTSYATCAPDFFARATGTQTGNIVIAGRNLGMPQRQTIYVDGNAFITGNITTANGNYNSVDHIPAFRLIVRGNIYVEPGVTQLSGLYVAQPNPTSPDTTGRFYSCGSQTWAAGHTPAYVPNATDMNGPCANPLTVIGAVAADRVKLTRTRGTVSQSATSERYNTAYPAGQGPAETFIYSPDVWLGGALGSPNDAYDSINVLAPLL